MARRASPEGDVFFWLQRLLASLHENLHSRVPCAPEFDPSPLLAPRPFFATLIHLRRSLPSQPDRLFPGQLIPLGVIHSLGTLPLGLRQLYADSCRGPPATLLFSDPE